MIDLKLLILIVSLVTLFIIYILGVYIFQKKKDQPFLKHSLKMENAFKGRKRPFLIMEGVLMVSLVLSMIGTGILYPSPLLPPMFLFVFFFLIYLIRGTEQWMYKRDKLEYMHLLWASAFSMCRFLVMLFAVFWLA